jgi:hypothetical protein
MRRSLCVAIVLVALLAIGTMATANTAGIKVVIGDLIFTFNGKVSPGQMPKDDYVPAATTISGKIETTNGTHPSALREVVVDVDKDVKINVKGLPACKPGQLEARDTKAAKKVCGDTVLGSGLAHVEIAFPEQKPILVTSPITVFNGGEKGGKVKLLIHVFITVPVPAAIVTDVTITRKGSGLHSVAKIPVAAGGSGSAIDFKFKVGRTYTYKGKKVGYGEARCPDGKFKVNVRKVLFKNEAKIPGSAPTTTLKGSFAVPCTPKG